MMAFSEAEIETTKRAAGAVLLKHNIDLNGEIEPRSWSDLCQASRDVGTAMSGLLAEVTPANETAYQVLRDVRCVIESMKDAHGKPDNRDNRPLPADGEVDAHEGGHGYTMRHRPGSRQEDDGEEVTRTLRHEERMTDWARTENRAPEIKGLTSGALLRAMVLGPKTEAEKRALSEGTDSAGGYTVPDILSAAMIDRMRRKSVVSRAGARTVPLTSDTNYVAKVLTDPVPAWRAENAEITNSDATFGRVSMAPKSLAVLCRVSRELLEDSMNIDRVLPDIIAKAMASELDRVCLFGSGSGAEPQGLINMSSLPEVALDDQLTDHANGAFGPLIAARGLLLAANSEEPTAFILNPREDETYTGLRNGNGDPVIAPAKIARIPQLVSTVVPTDLGVADNESVILTGDFTRMLVGIRNNLRIEILKERYAEFHQYAFIAHMRATVAVEQIAAFAAITGILPEA